MALANSRQLQIPTMENESLHNSTSPVFQVSSLGINNNQVTKDSNNNNKVASLPGSQIVNFTDINPSMNLNNNNSFDTINGMVDSFNPFGTSVNGSNSSSSYSYNNGSVAGPLPSATPVKRDAIDNSAKSKKDNTPKKENPLLDISKLIPVTGERPKPEDRTSPLDDDVLFAVFVILWEMDPNQQGMTVKQLCDHLLTKHPDMSNLSTKLSNLISAKLNAYVKKIEKGEKTLLLSLIHI